MNLFQMRLRPMHSTGPAHHAFPLVERAPRGPPPQLLATESNIWFTAFFNFGLSLCLAMTTAKHASPVVVF